MNKTTTLLGFITVALICPPALAHAGPDFGCELHLKHVQVVERLVEEAVEFESSLVELETLCHGQRCLREAQILRFDFNNYIEDLLGHSFGPAELSSRFAELSKREASLRAGGEPDLETASVLPPTILSFSENPEDLPPNTPIALGNPDNSIRNVIFTNGVLPEFLKLEPYMQAKFLRSIFKGVVGPVDEAGVKYLKHVAKHLVEVKIYAEARLLGCLKNDRLIIFRLLNHKKHSFARYASICD